MQKKMKPITIANAQAFWGDRKEASIELLQQQPDLDFLTLDYLSEVSLSIMAVQRTKDPKAGYAKDFVDVIKSLRSFWEKGSHVKVITNAGGLEPIQCAIACAEVLKGASRPLKIGVVHGDDVLNIIKTHPEEASFCNLETKNPVESILDRLTTANAYLGAQKIAEALTLEADIVITGRTADPSLTVAPCMAHFGWDWNDYDRMAQATVAGHLIECGTQVTGGIATDWLDLLQPEAIGFPIVEMSQDGTFIVTKGKNAGGSVTIDHVKEQLLYEIGDPEAYLSPDVTVSFLSLQVEQVDKDRILVKGATGRAPPPTYKVSATYKDGYRAEGTLAIVGQQCQEKARRCGAIILEKMKKAGFAPERSIVECLGCGDIVPGITLSKENSSTPFECLLRVAVADQRLEVLEYFAQQMAPMVTSGPPGTTGYTTGRPHIRPIFGYWPCLIDRKHVEPTLTWVEVKR